MPTASAGARCSSCWRGGCARKARKTSSATASPGRNCLRARVRPQPKDATQRRHDAVLAALSYAEMGGRAALSTSLRDLVPQVERPLCDAIVSLLEVPDPAIQSSDRI